MEHGAMSYTIAQNMIMAAQCENCSPIIRVSQNSESSILRFLDLDPEE